MYVWFGVWGWGKKEKKCCNFYSEFQLDNQTQLAFVSHTDKHAYIQTQLLILNLNCFVVKMIMRCKFHPTDSVQWNQIVATSML